MKLSTQQLAQMREVVSELLDELQIEAYLFEIEPQQGLWEIKLECAVDEGWETFLLKAQKDYLLHGFDDAVLRDVLLDNWRVTLSNCKIKTS